MRWVIGALFVFACDQGAHAPPGPPEPVPPSGMVFIAGGASDAPFFIDRAEVSADQYDACVAADACPVRDAPPPGACLPPRQDSEGMWKPRNGERAEGQFRIKASTTSGGDAANFVGPAAARSYCEWVHKRLPTAEEWRRASRGPKRRTSRGQLVDWTSDSHEALSICVPVIACAEFPDEVEPCETRKLQDKDTGVRCAADVTTGSGSQR
jgi:hypothetical protein